MDTTKIQQQIESVYDEIIEMRRHIHMHPELSQHEEHTMSFVSAQLAKWGIPHQTHVGGFGIVAVIGNPKAAYAVGIRADMDALPIQEKNDVPYKSQVPGVMHACGHDIHTATLLGTAKILKILEPELDGAVKLFFQPAEETVGGAKPMIAEGCLLNPPVKRMLGFHIDPKEEVGKVTFSPQVRSASSTVVEITVHGKSSHGAEPEKGVDAILIASQLMVTLQSIASRSVAPTTPVALTIGKFTGGTKANIVAQEVVMEGTLRATDCATRDLAKARIRAIADSTAALYGGTADVMLFDKYPPVVNDRECTIRMMKVAENALGADSVITAEVPTLTAEDVAFFMNEVRGTFFDLGCSPKESLQPQSLHNEYLCPDESCMKTGMLLEVLGALAFLEELKEMER